MNIIYIAYSCSPFHGSEDRIGWKIPLESSKKNNVIVITKKEHEKVINKYKETNSCNIEFYFIDIPEIYKKIFKGFSYSVRLNIWQKYAQKKADSICRKSHIDIIHQITPVEFRSIGDYGKMTGVKYVCGPVGGGERVPGGLLRYIKKQSYVEILRSISNRVNLYKLKFRGTLKRCDAILFANKETEIYMKPALKDSRSMMQCVTETGIDNDEIADDDEVSKKFEGKRIFLVSGRLNYRKGHAFLLEALKGLPDNLDYELYIVGEGKESRRLKKAVQENKLSEKVVFTGRIPFEKMEEIYRNVHVLIMPSIRETTGSVILEAMSKGVPVITINKFGGAVILKNDNSWLYDGKNHKELVDNLRKTITESIVDVDILKMKSRNAIYYARQNTWEIKSDYYDSVYKSILSDRAG